jgi:hypothetical protein
MSYDYVIWPNSTIPRAINPHYNIKYIYKVLEVFKYFYYSDFNIIIIYLIY